MTASGATHTRLGVMISGRGSNLVAIHRAIETGVLPDTTIARVVVNHPETVGEAYCLEKKLPVTQFDKADFESREAFDAAVRDALLADGVDLLILAGYDRILTVVLLSAFEGRVLNIHPSLLPAYGGKNMVGLRVHQAVIAAGESVSGCTVHGVTAVVDGGPVVAQARVAVEKEDTPETLAQRVLMMEHQLYPQAIRSYIQAGFTAGSLSSPVADCQARPPQNELVAATVKETTL